MATISQINQINSPGAASLCGNIESRERLKSQMLRAWIFAGLFFMALPGTLLGFSNLLAISTHHGLGALPAAWIQGHGHAQVFGWIGSFVLGIGFYSQPARGRSVLRIPLACLAFWTSGVAMRWAASIYGWHWRSLFAVSASFEMIACPVPCCSFTPQIAGNGARRTGEAADGALDGLSVLEHSGSFGAGHLQSR